MQACIGAGLGEDPVLRSTSPFYRGWTEAVCKRPLVLEAGPGPRTASDSRRPGRVRNRRVGTVWFSSSSCLSFSPVGPAAVGLPPIGLRAVAAGGFLPEAEGPGLSPALPRFHSSPHPGVPSPPVPHCPSLLWVPDQFLCPQSDVWGFHGPWLLGRTLPQLVRARAGPGLWEWAWGEPGLPVFLPNLLPCLSHSACPRSMLLGVGTPPVDSLSPLILGIMAVALGAPGLMLLAGGVFLLLGQKQCSEYQPIN